MEGDIHMKELSPSIYKPLHAIGHNPSETVQEDAL